MNDLVWRGAGELATIIRERQASSREVVEAHLRQIERVNPRLNAVVTLDAEGALRAAAERDAALGRGDEAGPLHGVPLTLKDCHETACMRTTAGYPEWADHVPGSDSVVVAKLRAAGAVIVGKTNVPPLLGDVQTDNPIFGRTNNPWDIERMPGGSSGGAAAALASGMTPLEIGSDIGGSIRIPSHCCGTFGLKPSDGRVSNHGHRPGQFGAFRDAWFMNAIGPMARNIDDLELGFRVIAGPADVDPSPLPFPVGPSPMVEPSKMRLAWTGSYPGLPIFSDVRQAIERLAADLASAGAEVEESTPAGLDWDEQGRVRTALREALRWPGVASGIAGALAGRARFQCEWDGFFERYDALIAPAMMTTAFRHCPREAPIPFDGVDYDYGYCADYCRPFNLTGHPAVALPIGFDRDGVPIGVQVVGARWHDERLLGVARGIASVSGAFVRPPEY